MVKICFMTKSYSRMTSRHVRMRGEVVAYKVSSDRLNMFH